MALGEKARYTLKVWHTYMHLSGDTTPLYEFPIIQFCWKKQYIPRLCLVDKEDGKQDKLVSLQIGSLVRFPAPFFSIFSRRKLMGGSAGDDTDRATADLAELGRGSDQLLQIQDQSVSSHSSDAWHRRRIA